MQQQKPIKPQKLALNLLKVQDHFWIKQLITAMQNHAISVRNACKSYQNGHSAVLKDLCMTVEPGTIYGLLGPSGCGKSTLLSLCVGLKRLNSGQIHVFGKTPGSRGSRVPGSHVGYMPQDLSLYGEFTVKESLLYFGVVYGMTPDEIDGKMTFILELLDLPPSSRRISQLSGGQQRRVSFALATFHEAPLLILDEPTVGVDPMLRESIWNYLCQLVVKQKTTVLITTHYIEEARRSHQIGVMRNGRLIAEKSPDAFFKEHPTLPLLEQIVLQLYKDDCQYQKKLTAKTSNSSFNNPRRTETSSNVHNARPTLVAFSQLESGSGSTFSIWNKLHNKSKEHETECLSWLEEMTEMKFRVTALLGKNLTVLLRNLWFLLFVFLVPAMQIVLICLAIGPPPKNLYVGVINHEVDHENDTSLAPSSPYCEVVPDCTPPYLFSCRFLSNLPNETFNLMKYNDETSALQDIKKGNLWAYISIPANYSYFVVERATSELYASDETFDGSRITFEMDMSNQEVGQTMKRTFFEIYQKYIMDTSLVCGQNPRSVEMPLNFLKPVYGSTETSFREFLAPSVLLGLLFFFPLCSSGISYITEKKTGTLDRSLVAGVTNAEIMISFLITQSIVLFGQSAFAFLILTVGFRIEVMGSLVLAVFLAVLIGIGGMSMGFLIATICTEEIHAVLLAIGSFFPNFILAGIVWPTQAMPVMLQYISYLLPCTLACESMRSIVSRGWDLNHTAVWSGFASTIAWICIYWTLTIFIHKCKG